MSRVPLVSAREKLRKAIALKSREAGALKRKAWKAETDLNVLVQQLAGLEREGISATEIDRSTSIRRILVEQAVIRYMSKKKDGLASSDELWPFAYSLGVAKRSTFRSILRRMALKGMVRSAGRGVWLLGDGVKIAEPRNAAAELAMAQIDLNFSRRTPSQSS